MFNINKFTDFVRTKDGEEKKTLKEQESSFNYLDEEKVNQFQEEKEKIMEQLHQKFREIDQNPESEVYFEEENLRTVTFENENFYIFGKKGRKEEISWGEIMTASLWAKNLKLSGNFPQEKKKAFLLNEAKRKISFLWDQQIKEAFEGLSQTTYVEGAESIIDKNQQEVDNLPYGFVAERMIESIFSKLAFDFPDLPFEFLKGDVYDDVVNKVDFCFKIKNEYIRAIKSKICEDGEEECKNIASEIGVQYSMNESKKDFKEKQLEKSRREQNYYDELVLVTMPIAGIKKALEEWKEKKTKTSLSGPEEYLDQKTKESLFKAILNKLPEELEIDVDKYWEEVEGSF